MKYKPQDPLGPLSNELKNILNDQRKKNKFSPKQYLKLKLFLIKKYFKKHEIKVGVVALSGGIDSSLVLAILKKCQEETGYPEKIIPVMLPVKDSGVSNQDQAVLKGKKVCKFLNLKDYLIDLTIPFSSLRDKIEKEFKIIPSDWAKGQLTPYLRTPTLYYITTLLLEKYGRTVLCGTTNRSEGAYLGYIGKASDAMVDLQIISDLYKSEVLTLSRYLNIPEEIVDQVPNGDMFDNRSDEEVFGASYDFVELFLRDKKRKCVKNLKESKKQWENGCKNLELLHSYNKHKYIGHSAAIHFDVYDTYIENGWINNSTLKLRENEVDYSKIVNLKNIESSLNINNKKKCIKTEKIEKLVNKESIEKLTKELKNFSWTQAGIDGYKNDKEKGSYRLSFFSKDLADKIFQEIKEIIPTHEIYKEDLFEISGVSSLFRVIKYPKGGKLVPHIDFPYHYNEKRQTLKSLIIVLKKADIGGEFSFIFDEKKDGKDWIKMAEDKEIVKKIEVNSGDILVFDHGRLHQSSEIIEGEKIIIRTDVIYDKRS